MSSIAASTSSISRTRDEATSKSRSRSSMRRTASASGSILREITRAARAAMPTSVSTDSTASAPSSRFCGFGSASRRYFEANCGRYWYTSTHTEPSAKVTGSYRVMPNVS